MDLHNEWNRDYLATQTHTTGPNAIEYDFTGDVTSLIPAQITDDTNTNPFAALHYWTVANGYAAAAGYPGSGVAPNPTTVTYDMAAGVTRVVLAGAALPFPVPNPWPGPNWETDVDGHFTYHSGMNQGNGELTPVSHHRVWSNADGTTQTQELYDLDVAWQGNFTKPKAQTAYAEVFVGSQDEAIGGWHLLPYLVPAKGKKATFDLTNSGKTAVTIGVLGIELGISVPTNPECVKDRTCPDNQKLLEQLNEAFAPIPGQGGSPFTPVKPPAKALKPGVTYRFTAP